MAINGTQIYLGGQPIKLILNNNFVDVNPFTPPEPKILDIYTGSAAAYSLRKLSNSYTGSAIQVRRSSDNTVQDIGFDGAGNLDTSSLSTFLVGSTTGQVVRWYDQSGNNQTMIESNGNPAIKLSGTIITQGGLPAIRFDGVNDSFAVSGVNNPFTFTGGVSVAHVSYKDSTSFKAYETIFSAGSTGNSTNNDSKSMALGFGNSASVTPKPTVVTDIWKPSGIQYDGTVSTNSRYIGGYYISNWSTHRSTGTSNVRLNGSELTMKTYGSVNPTSLNTNPIKIAVFDSILASSYWAGDIQEVIAWASDRSSDRLGIEGNMNNYYSVY